MNILPIILGLILIISFVTIEKLYDYKNHTALQNVYQDYIVSQERRKFNEREALLYKSNSWSQRQLSFSVFVNKETRKTTGDEKIKQIELIATNFIKILYGHADFYKKLEAKRPEFVTELLHQITAATEAMSVSDKLRRAKDIARIRLGDDELQEAFYHMLKGTIQKPNSVSEVGSEQSSQAYYSLLHFINTKADTKVTVQFASLELLKAIFDDSVAEQIVTLREDKKFKKSPDAVTRFQSEFKGKQRSGISEEMLDFSLSVEASHKEYR